MYGTITDPEAAVQLAQFGGRTNSLCEEPAAKQRGQLVTTTFPTLTPIPTEKTLGNYLAAIRTEFGVFESLTLATLERAKVLGDLFEDAKKSLTQPEYQKLVEQSGKSERTIGDWRRVAAHWSEISKAESVAAALEMLPKRLRAKSEPKSGDRSEPELRETAEGQPASNPGPEPKSGSKPKHVPSLDPWEQIVAGRMAEYAPLTKLFNVIEFLASFDVTGMR